MAFDGLFTRTMIDELDINTGRINKITQPDSHTLIFTVRANRQNVQLLISAHPNFARFHLTQQKFSNPFEPPMFLRVLRKHLDGGIIQSFNQIGNDRIIEIKINNRDEIGDPTVRYLIVELMGKHSNIILTDHNKKILESLKHLTPNTNTARTIMPGFQYELPPTEKKLNPFQLSEISSHLPNDGSLKKNVLHTLEGFSPLAVDEMLSLDDNINHAFNAFMSHLKHIKPVYYAHDNKEYFYFMPLNILGTPDKTYDSLSLLLDDYYQDRAARERVKSRSMDLSRHISQLIQKDEKKLSKLIEEFEETKSRDEMQLFGELLTANMYQLKQGMQSIEVLNYYTNDMVTISLDPRKSPAKNAQFYYRQYNRLKARQHHAEVQIKETQEELEYLNTLQAQLDYISLDDIEGMREELQEQGLIKKKRETKKKQNKIQLEHYISTEGIDIFVGKNNIQNDYLTNKIARKTDTWLHTKDIPGSHVVIKTDTPGEKTLQEAAQIAAYFSKAGQSSQVPVDYTLIKHVHKPSGAKPGFVTYTDQSTLYVNPEKQIVESLKK